MDNQAAFGVFLLLAMVLVPLVLLFVGISRWVFRINTIVERLDRVVELLARTPTFPDKPR